jgi:hypothetical protein
LQRSGVASFRRSEVVMAMSRARFVFDDSRD